MEDLLLTAPPKSMQIADILRNEISSRKLKPGSRLQPARALAEKFSVSYQVIQRSFEMLAKEGLIETHVGRGTFVAPPARAISAKTVILLLALTQDKHARLPMLLPSILQKHGYVTYVFDMGHGNDAAILSRIKALLRQKPYAVVAEVTSSFNFSIFKSVDPSTRMLMVNRYDARERIGAAYVLEDYSTGGYLMCKHLIGRGRSKIAFGSFQPEPLSSQKLMMQGIRKAIAEAGLAPFRFLDYGLCDDGVVKEFERGGAPDGFIFAFDYLYGKVKKIADKRGLMLGKDYDAVGYGDTPWAEIYGIPTMDPMIELMSEKVAEALDSGRNMTIEIKPVLKVPAIELRSAIREAS